MAYCFSFTAWNASIQRMASNEQLITTGAILTTIPIVFTASYLLFTLRFLESCSVDTCLKDCTKTVVFITQLLAGILEIGGGVLLMVGSVNLRNQENVLAFGISAGVFAIISGLTCICAQFFLCFCTYNQFATLISVLYMQYIVTRLLFGMEN